MLVLCFRQVVHRQATERPEPLVQEFWARQLHHYTLFGRHILTRLDARAA